MKIGTFSMSRQNFRDDWWFLYLPKKQNLTPVLQMTNQNNSVQPTFSQKTAYWRHILKLKQLIIHPSFWISSNPSPSLRQISTRLMQGDSFMVSASNVSRTSHDSHDSLGCECYLPPTGMNIWTYLIGKRNMFSKTHSLQTRCVYWKRFLCACSVGRLPSTNHA